jgi:ribosomal protein L11 methylase PrmA
VIEVAGFVIMGDWDTSVPLADKHVIRIKPSHAFGAGWHPVTQAMLRLLSGVGVAGKTVVDLGTGNGVLAIAAYQRGALVTACDTAGWALDAARENGSVNDAVVDWRLGSLDVIERADIILCTVDNDEWVDCQDWSAHITPGGALYAIRLKDAPMLDYEVVEQMQNWSLFCRRF